MKGIGILIIFFFLIVLGTIVFIGVKQGWFNKLQQQKPENVTEVLIKATNSSNDFIKMNFTIYDTSGRSIIESTTSTTEWTSLKLTPESKKLNYLISSWNDNSYRKSEDISVSEFYPNQITLTEDKICNPAIVPLSRLSDTEQYQKILLNIGCDEGRLQTPLICTSWSQGMVSTRRSSDEWTCDIAYFLNKKPLYWKNFTYANESSKTFMATDFNNYACGSDSQIFCKELFNKTCKMDGTPLQGIPAFECMPIPSIEQGTNKTIEFDSEIIIGRLFQGLDKINFFVVVPECNPIFIDKAYRCNYKHSARGKIFNQMLPFTNQ